MDLPRAAARCLALATATALLTACTTSNPPTGTATTSPTSSPSSPAPSPSSPAPSPISTRTAAPETASPTPVEDPNAVVLELAIADGQVAPSGKKVEVARGQRVNLSVTSDIDDQIHAHTAGEGYELEVRAGRTTRGAFVAEDRGSFEIESHELGKVFVILSVR